MSMVFKVWLREPRLAWKNDGGPIPRGMRSRLECTGIKAHSVKIKGTSERVPRGHYAVVAGEQTFAFSPAEMRRLYSRVPL
jgi:hypothetical protein